MENNKIHIEELIREIDAEKRKGPKLDADKIIRQANLEIERRELQRKKKRTGYIATASVLVAVICVSFTYISLESGGGFADDFRQLFFRDKMEDSTVQDNFIAGEDKIIVTDKIISQDSISDYLSGDYGLPANLPEGFVEDKVYARFIFDEFTSIKIRYTNYEDAEEIIYEIMPLERKKTYLTSIDNEEGTLEDITKNEINYTCYENAKSSNKIVYWDSGEIFYIIKGDLSKDDLINIAVSVQ